jgi:DnaB helicase-like protein/primase-like protein
MDNYQFFKSLYQFANGQIELRALPSRARTFVGIGDTVAIENFCQKHNYENIHFGVGTRDGDGGTKKNIVSIPAVWTDIDFKDTPREIAWEKLKAFPFKPSITVKSGGGIHLYWFLKESAGKNDLEAIEDVNRRIAVALGGDMAAIDAARIMRVPGTLNHKYDPPRRCELVQLNDFTYSLDDFLGILPPIQKEKPEPNSQGNNDTGWLAVAMQPCSEGNRNATAAKLAGYYINKLPQADVLMILQSWNKSNNPPLPDDELNTVIKSISRHEPEIKQRQIDMANVYDAGRMIEAYKKHIKSLKQNQFITGIHEIDKRIRGVSGGEVMVILARSGAFKTATLQNLLVRYTHNSAWGAVFFSIEMPVASVAERYFQIFFGEPGFEVESMFSNESDPDSIEIVSHEFAANMKNLFVVPARVGLSDIPAYVRLIETEKNIKIGIIGIDYLGLMDGPGSNAYESMSRLAKGMKSTAKLVNLPLIVLCQTSRKGGTGYQEVSLDMARDSGAVEESADFCLGLWQNDLSDAVVEQKQLICKILKNRKGAVGTSWVLDMNPKTFKLGTEARRYEREKPKKM